MAKKSSGLFQRLLGRWTDPEEVPETPGPTPVRDDEVDILNFEGSDIRTIWLKDEQWWVAVDVCATVDIANPWNAISGLDEDEKGLRQMETLGGRQSMVIVNEPGLYHLLSKSNKPKAKAFWRWVRHEVLTSIRRTGAFTVGQPSIRSWIKNRGKRYGHSAGWLKKRQKVADGNKASDAQTFAIGGDARLCSMRYNWLYSGLFGLNARGLKKKVDCRDKDSPLDKMADVALGMYDLANSVQFKKMADGSIDTANMQSEVQSIGHSTRTATLGMLGSGYEFDAVENQMGHKILDAVKKQLQ